MKTVKCQVQVMVTGWWYFKFTIFKINALQELSTGAFSNLFGQHIHGNQQKRKLQMLCNSLHFT